MSPLAQKARNTWRTLTSMGTALVLLFLLALAAIPGALLPQRSLNEAKVAEYIAEHPTIGPWLDRLGAFEVFSSFWFTAIYVLLFVSLVGCLTPRLIEHARSLRATPVPAPRNLGRLPKHHTAEVAGEPDAVAAALSEGLRGWRRVNRHEGEITEISAEKGYLREFGNIVFHFSLLGLLVAVAAGKLFGYEGNVIVIADGGPGFCSASPAAFDSFRAGNTVDGTSLHPICLRVNDFEANYLPTGQATSFAANIDYQAGADLAANAWRPYRLQVNHPLRVGGDRVYLQGHGYAPTFSVTFPDGQTRTSTVQWRPDDPLTLLSSGVIRVDPPGGTYPDADERRKHQIAVQGLFAPTEQLHGTLLSSSFPALNDPAVAVDIYRGDTGLDTGRPQSLFSLDPRLIDQGRLTKVARVNLGAGEQTRLDDGTVVRFDGAVPFINVQVSHDPAQVWVLVFALTMMAGLLVSLVIRRRRVWVRVMPSPQTPGTVSVELGGLARTDNSGWGDEFERLTQRLLAGFDAAAAAAGKREGTMNTEHIDIGLARYSDWAFTSSVVVLVAALLLLAVELAYTRGRKAESRELVAAGSVPDSAAPGVVAEAPKRPIDERVGRAGLALVYVGIGLLLACIVLRGLATARVPWGNMYEFINLTCFSGLIAAAVVLRRPQYRALWVFVLVPVLILLTVSGRWLYTNAAPVMPALQSYWLPIHVSVVSLGSGVFLVAGVASILFLVKMSRLGAPEAEGTLARIVARLPDAQTLDRIAYRTTIFAFPVFGFGVIFGAIWAEEAWGRYWGWDPKETVSFIAWVIYAAYLHARSTAGWRDKKAAWINVAGFVAMVFNLFFINLVTVGLHSYAGVG